MYSNFINSNLKLIPLTEIIRMTTDSFSKILFSLNISGNLNTLFRLLYNAKKYKFKRKNGSIDLNDNSFEDYLLTSPKGKFTVRMRTFKGDLNIFNEIFWEKSYLIPENLLKNPKVIVDLGAHVGFASVFYATQYPDAKIYSVEASKQNFSILDFNAGSFPNITVTNKAIYSDDGFILFDESGLSYNTKISDKGDQLEAISVNTLLKNYGIDKVDLMKIDIEGAEKDILEKNKEWLQKTENIIIELHKPYNISDLERDLKPYGFKIILPESQNGLKNIFATKTEEIFSDSKVH